MRGASALVAVAALTATCTYYGPDPPQTDPSRFTFDVPVCGHAGTAAIDPIVSPGEPSAHSHQFFGTFPSSTDDTTAKLRMLPSTCTNDPTNRSSYWLPTAYDATGTEIVPDNMRLYYAARGKQGTVYPFPVDFGMVTDEAMFTDATRTQVFLGWADCWDGTADAPPDHADHVTDGVQGVCPSTHPIPLPRIRAHVNYPEPVDHFSVAEEDLHADFLHGWDEEGLARLVNGCLNIGRDHVDNNESCDVGVPQPSLIYD